MPRLLSRLTFVLGSILLLLVGLAAPSEAKSHHHYTKWATARMSATAKATVSAAMTVTVKASAGSPAVTATAQASASATASRSATQAATARAHGRATTKSAASRKARSAARAAAHRLAATRAKASARARALAAARVTARARAMAAALAKASVIARTAAAKQAAQPCGPTIAKTGGGTWVCTFDDEFNGTTLDPKKWIPVTTGTSGLVTGGPGCFVDSPKNISVSGGYLNLTARRETSDVTCRSGYGSFATRYTTGQVASSGNFAQTYGRFAVRAKFPATAIAGLQSSLWMWPEDRIKTGLTGEIDIAEEYSQRSDRVIPYLHYTFDPLTVNPATSTNIVTNYNCMISNVGAFHEYALEWTASTITIRFDGRVCLVNHPKTTTASPYQQPFFLALSQALGLGTNAVGPSTPLPATTQIDWVRAWK